MSKYKLNSHVMVKPNCPHLVTVSKLNYAPLPRHAGEWWNYSADQLIICLEQLGICLPNDFQFPISGLKGRGCYLVCLLEEYIEKKIPTTI